MEEEKEGQLSRPTAEICTNLKRENEPNARCLLFLGQAELMRLQLQSAQKGERGQLRLAAKLVGAPMGRSTSDPNQPCCVSLLIVGGRSEESTITFARWLVGVLHSKE